MMVRRPRSMVRRARHHGLKAPSQFESPSMNWEFFRHINSPWVVVSLWLFQIILLVLIMMLFGYAREFSDYLNQRGDYADRQRIEENQAVCSLISQLRADPSGQLQAIADRLHCKTGPIARTDGAQSSPSSVPIGPTPSFSTATPTPGSQAPTGGGSGHHATGNGPLGTKVPAPTSAPSRTPAPQTTTPPTSPSSGGSAGGGSGSSVTLCVPLTDLCATI